MMFHRQVKSDKLYQGIVNQIQDQVFNGKLASGDRLPSEKDLAEQFGVSRTAVREAIRILNEQGLVRVYHGRGSFIAEPTTDIVADSFGLLLQVERCSHSDLLEARYVLETEIVGLAAQRAVRENVLALHKHLNQMSETVREPDAFIIADTAFHEELARATGNPVFVVMIQPIAALLRETRTTLAKVSGAPERVLRHHRAIYEAVAAGDVEGSRKAMRDHLRQVARDAELAEKRTAESQGTIPLPDP